MARQQYRPVRVVAWGFLPWGLTLPRRRGRRVPASPLPATGQARAGQCLPLLCPLLCLPTRAGQGRPVPALPLLSSACPPGQARAGQCLPLSPPSLSLPLTCLPLPLPLPASQAARSVSGPAGTPGRQGRPAEQARTGLPGDYRDGSEQLVTRPPVLVNAIFDPGLDTHPANP